MKIFKTLILKKHNNDKGGGCVKTQNNDVSSKFMDLGYYKSNFQGINKLDRNIEGSNVKGIRGFNENLQWYAEGVEEFNEILDLSEDGIREFYEILRLDNKTREFYESLDIEREKTVDTIKKHRINVTNSLGSVVVIPTGNNIYKTV
ncbi:hypothetical protein [Clostridium felsineum]|uniref:hypothetical protein n=1 Tax=Clostridium felsineum TaxID=36839 RepID=UPI00098CE78A|nr:hypothetical protein [Clostridium felsineum]URZ14355.1 hypothetical protein CLFE_003520 [Clostridium felsineum DSM 794]